MNATTRRPPGHELPLTPSYAPALRRRQNAQATSPRAPAALTAQPGTNPGETNVISNLFSPAATGTSVRASPNAPRVSAWAPLTVTVQPASCGTETMSQPSESAVTVPLMSELSRTDEIILNLKYAVRRAAGSVIQWYGLDTSSVIVEQAPLVIPSAHENEKRIQRAK